MSAAPGDAAPDDAAPDDAAPDDAAPHRRGVALAWGGLVLRATAVAVLSAVTGLLTWSLVPALAGWSPRVVLTGSMAPRIAPGDVVLTAPVAPDLLRPGLVVLFPDPARPERTVLHRVVERDGALLTTRGDGNAVADAVPLPVEEVLGVGRLRVPAVGTPVLWRHGGQVEAPGALGTAAVLASVAVLVVVRRPADPPVGDEPDGAGGPGDAGRAP